MSWRPYEDPCPCGERLCVENEVGWKLTKYGHINGCRCKSCTQRRARAKGQRSQTAGRRKMGDTAKHVAADEEAQRALQLTVQVEFKKGYKDLTTKFYLFIATKFFEHALDQATRAVRIGEGSLPGVCLDDSWLIVDIRKGIS